MDFDKFSGCIFGLAVGDAVGAPVEFNRKGTFPLVTDMVSGGTHGLKAGQWTDDTSMALCLLDSLIKDGFNPKSQLQNYVRWYQEGFLSSTGDCFDIGCTTATALQAFMRDDTITCAATSSRSMSGNGSIMRLAPVPMYYAKATEQELMERAAESSRVTHASIVCQDACRLMALIIGRLLRGSKGVSKRDVLSGEIPTFCPEVQSIVNGDFLNKEVSGAGYVVSTLEAALWGFFTTDSFRDGLLKVVNLGDDTDTTGAVYGQIAGAFYGFAGIPEHWTSQVYNKDMIHSMIAQLYERTL